MLGISQTSKASLLAQLGELGNLATVQASSALSGQPAELPTTAQGMAARIGPVTSVASIGEISGVNVYRSPYVPAINTSGIVADRRQPDAARHRGREDDPRRVPQPGHRPLPGRRPGQ